MGSGEGVALEVYIKGPCLAPLFICRREFVGNTSSLRVENLSSAIVVSLKLLAKNKV